MCVCAGVTAQEAQKNTRSEKLSKLFLGGGVGVFFVSFWKLFVLLAFLVVYLSWFSFFLMSFF